VVCALSLAGLGATHAAPPKLSATDAAGRQPCNDVCKAYMAWSDRVSAMLHPSTVPQSTVHDAKPDQMVHHPVPRTRQQGLNSFAQFPVRRDATAPSAETAPVEVAPSRRADEIADRFPTTAGFVTALLASTAGATNDAPESAVVPVSDALPATRATGTIGASAIETTTGGLDLRFTMSLLLALCILSALVFRGWSRARTPRAMR
jgi:hypothetical protein